MMDMMPMGRRDVHTEIFRHDEQDGHDVISHGGRRELGVFNHEFTLILKYRRLAYN